MVSIVDGQFLATASLAVTAGEVPISTSVLGIEVDCTATVDTSRGSLGTASVTAQAEFFNAEDPAAAPDRVAFHNAALEGVEASDLEITGDNGCSFGDAVLGLVLDQMVLVMQAVIADAVAQLEACADGSGGLALCP